MPQILLILLGSITLQTWLYFKKKNVDISLCIKKHMHTGIYPPSLGSVCFRLKKISPSFPCFPVLSAHPQDQIFMKKLWTTSLFWNPSSKQAFEICHDKAPGITPMRGALNHLWTRNCLSTGKFLLPRMPDPFHKQSMLGNMDQPLACPHFHGLLTFQKLKEFYNCEFWWYQQYYNVRTSVTHLGEN